MAQTDDDSRKKVQLLLWLDPAVDTKFRELIQEKYKKYEKGILSYEGEMALRYWLTLHTKAQTPVDAKPPNPTPKVQVQFMRIKEFLLNGLYFELLPGQQVPTKHLHAAIMNTRGSDPRTVIKWMMVFHKNGLIKPVTSATWEII